MGNPLQDQLLKAGLVSNKQVNKAKQEKRSSRKKKKGAAQAATPRINQTRQEQLRQAEKNRKQNRQRNRERHKTEVRDQVTQLIRENRLDQKNGETPYYFALGKKIKKVWVDKTAAEQLSTGRLAIVRMQGIFEVVPAKVADQIRARSPETVVLVHDPGTGDTA